ncbi:MAG: HlyC/CorC family transporter [Alphaproteobacteria bacterium]
MLFVSVGVIILLACLAFVLSASETAVTAASRIKLHQLAKQGDSRAEGVLALQKKMGQLISTILLLNTWAITGMTAVATHLLTMFLGSLGAVYSAVLMGAFITIYLEVMPKIYVYHHAEQTALRLNGFLRFLRWALLPLTSLVDGTARFSLKAMGAKLGDHTLTSTLEELRGAIDLHVGEGAVIAHERTMLRSILDLTQVEVSEIMVHRNKLFGTDVEENSQKTVQKILQSPYTRIPLWQDSPDNIIGVLHVKNLLRHLKANPSNLEQIDLLELAIKPWFIPESTTLFSQLQSFRERREHMAFVVDEYGSLLGMVTLEDILEEIVGEIVDEHDVEIPGVRVAPDGSYLIQGAVTLRDLNRQYDWNLPDDEASTLAGLVLYETGHIPEVNQTFHLHGLKIKILRRYRNQLTLLRVERLKN